MNTCGHDKTVAGGEAGAVVDEHADTWGFSWMPAIEDFVDQAAATAEGEDHESSAGEPPLPHGVGNKRGDESGVGRNNSASAVFEPVRSVVELILVIYFFFVF